MSSRPASVVADVILDVPVEQAWAAVVDWDRQSEWVLGSRVRATTNGGVGLGGGIEAFTGLAAGRGGRLGVLDTMVIIEWEPPNRCTVRHTGRAVRGTGVFEVFALPGGRSRFVWSEELDLPLGRLGQLGWPLVRPVVTAGVKLSLNKLARSVAAERDGEA